MPRCPVWDTRRHSSDEGQLLPLLLAQPLGVQGGESSLYRGKYWCGTPPEARKSLLSPAGEPPLTSALTIPSLSLASS